MLWCAQTTTTSLSTRCRSRSHPLSSPNNCSKTPRPLSLLNTGCQASRPFLPSTDLRIFSGRCRRSPERCYAIAQHVYAAPGPSPQSSLPHSSPPCTCYQQRSAMTERSISNPATARSPLPDSLVKTPQDASTLCLRCQTFGFSLLFSQQPNRFNGGCS